MKNIIKSIDYNALKNNILNIKADLHNTKLCAVIKSNAYGHGLNKIAKAIENYVDYFAVIDNKEAINLRKITKKHIIVLGSCNFDNLITAIQQNVEISVDNITQLKMIEIIAKNLKKTISIHLQLDTGLHRLGISNKKDIFRMLTIIKQNKYLNLSSVYSHLGDGANKSRTRAQIAQFNDLTSCITKTIFHLFNTQYWRQVNYLGMVRIGAGVYGYGHPKTTPVLSIQARIIKIQKIKKDEYIGYGSNHKAPKDMSVAILSIGYADGLPYAWAQSGWVLYKDKKCPFVADICMNMSIIEASPQMKVNDYVTILGKDNQSYIFANDIASHSHTIVDEVLTRFGVLSTD